VAKLESFLEDTSNLDVGACLMKIRTQIHKSKNPERSPKRDETTRQN